MAINIDPEFMRQFHRIVLCEDGLSLGLIDVWHPICDGVKSAEHEREMVDSAHGRNSGTETRGGTSRT